MTWTHFWDMHSGGSSKTVFEQIYIEGDEASAAEVFEKRFDRSPYGVTCDCCGADFAIREYDTLEKATEFDRERRPLDKYVLLPHVCVISESHCVLHEDCQEHPELGLECRASQPSSKDEKK